MEAAVSKRALHRRRGRQHPAEHDAGAEDQALEMQIQGVRRGGLNDLVPDQPLRARIADGRKGPLAVEVEPA